MRRARFASGLERWSQNLRKDIGSHVTALKPAAGSDAVKAFTKRIVDAMSADGPDRFLAPPPNPSARSYFAQWTRLDRRRAVFDARAAWRCHIHAA